MWTPNGPVHATALSETGDTLYLGGEFTFTEPYVGSFAIFTDASSKVNRDWPEVNGNIRAVEPDGSGGWYIGGDFTFVDHIYRPGLAHITASKRLDDGFAPNIATTRIETLCFYKGILYIGSPGIYADGEEYLSIAAMSTTGQVLNWKPK